MTVTDITADTTTDTVTDTVAGAAATTEEATSTVSSVITYLGDMISAPVQLLSQTVTALLPDGASGTTHDLTLIALIGVIIWMIWRVIRRIFRRARARVMMMVMPLLTLGMTQLPALGGTLEGVWNNETIANLVPAGFLGGWGIWVVLFLLRSRRMI